MSNVQKNQNEIENVGQAVKRLLDGIVPIKSLTVINDLVDGEIVGGVGDEEQFQSLAQGVSYVVIGLGKLPTDYETGINFIEIPKGR